jgi:hypothetical protein
MIAVGLAALAGLSFVNDISNKIDETTKPIYDFFEEREKEALLAAEENLNWKYTVDIKKHKMRNDVIRDQNNIKKAKYTTIKNNSDDVCELIYIDKLRISPEKLDVNNLCRKNMYHCQSIKIGVDNTVILIDEEFRIYNILLYVNDKFQLIKNDKIMIYTIQSNNVENNSVDMACKFGFW